MAAPWGAYLILIVAMVCNGTFGVLHKYCQCTNEAFVVWYCAGLVAVSLLSAVALPLLGEAMIFSPWGLISGLAQYIAIHFVFLVIAQVGVAVGTAAFASSIVLLSILADLLFLGDRVESPGFLALAVVLIVGGIAGIGASRWLASGSTLAPPSCRSAPGEGQGAGSGGTDANSSGTLHHGLLEAEAEEKGQRKDLGDGASKALADTSPSQPRSSTLLLVVSVMSIGVCFVTINFVQERFSKVEGIGYTWSFGIGIAASVLPEPLVFRLNHQRWATLTDLGSRRDALAGAASGLLWGLANASVNLALGLGTPLSVANSIQQCAVFIAGLWGLYFREFTSKQAIVVFFASSLVLFSGIILEAESID